jgi:hypothetical protein
MPHNSPPLIIKPSTIRLIEEALAIEAEEARSAGALGFMARMLVQATMPHRDPGEVSAWGRRNGAFSLVIQPGMTIDAKTHVPLSIGLPYGSLPRLLLAWISTEAVRTREPLVVLGDTLSSFMRELDLIPTGGRWGSITRLRMQMKRLFSASISCTYEGNDQWSNAGFRIADETHLWWDPKQPHQADLWHSTVTLGQKFFQELIEHPVPVDMRALKALRRSPMALDLYCWLTYRMSYLRKDTVIPWYSLQAQFGADYSRERDFKAKFNESLRKVLTVYTAAKAQPAQGGLLLCPSRTHVQRPEKVF